MSFIATILPFLLVGAVIGYILYSLRKGKKDLAIREERFKSAISAEADILSIQHGLGGTSMQGVYATIRFTLEVHSPGKPAYKTHTFWSVYPQAIGQLEIGKTVKIRIDAKDPYVVFPDLPGVEYNWQAAGNQETVR
jgi:hypothetical protein